MKKKYIIVFFIALAFIILAYLSFDESRVEYSDIDTAKKTGKTVQIIGKRLTDKPWDYDAGKNLLEFYIEDNSGSTSKIIFRGSPPNNFDISPSLVIKGKFENDSFIASDILTKCPSKYEGKDPALHTGSN